MLGQLPDEFGTSEATRELQAQLPGLLVPCPVWHGPQGEFLPPALVAHTACGPVALVPFDAHRRLVGDEVTWIDGNWRARPSLQPWLAQVAAAATAWASPSAATAGPSPRPWW